MRHCIFLTLIFLTGCSWSFNNVCTHGTADDVVDSEPTEQTTANPNISVPSPIPAI